ncbi:class I SAM-dependent methyltransferase [Nakamurella leprariae]|uniref:Methyltransferase domain-containing protein n=1 Tax=Nakamurella leprariae TaxID=2803911 RepID=A0A938YGS7_9ACTN|nr:methyltransferase domain-containing protein [Nakamurella leprariae]MBM9469236.1 methyltransferase domain-containing protein [Nakamurella leprariae]
MTAGAAGPDPVAEVLRRLIADRPHARVIDVGGGSGTRAVPLAQLGCRVLVVDSSADALAILHRRAAEAGVDDRVTGRQADADRLAEVVAGWSVAGDATVGDTTPGADLVLCHHVLEAVDDPAAAMAAIAAVLRPGGQVSVLVPGLLAAVLAQALAGRSSAARALLADPDGRWGADDPLRRRFTVEQLRGIFATADLEVESVLGIGVVPGVAHVGAAGSAEDEDEDRCAVEADLAVHPVAQQIAGDLLVVGRANRVAATAGAGSTAGAGPTADGAPPAR